MKKTLQTGIKTLFILFFLAFLQLAAYAQPVNGTTTFPGSQNFGTANFDLEGTLDGFIFLVDGRSTVSLFVSGGLLKMMASPLSGQSFEVGSIGSADNSSFTLKTITFQASSSFIGKTLDVTGWNNTVGEVASQAVAVSTANTDIVVDVSGNSSFANISSIEIKPPIGTTIGGTSAIGIKSITISAPTTASITAKDVLNTNAAVVDYSVVFVGPVTGLTASNFTLSGTGTNNASVGTPTSSDNITWNVPVTTGDNGTLLLTLANATNLSSTITNIPVNGDHSYHLLAPAPTVQAANMAAGSITSGTANLSWARGNGDNCIVFVSHASSGSPAPVTGASYNAAAAFSSGDQIGTSGWYAVYSGTGTSVQLTGLSAGQTYRAAVVEYGGTPGSGAENYLQSFGTNVSNLTAAALPVLAASSGSTGYTLGGAQVVVDPAITLTSTSTIASATITIGSNFNTGDQLTFVDQNGITGSYDAGAGVLSLTGSASAGNYQSALQSITFSTTSTSIATRTVTFKVNDGANDSNTASKGVSITPTTISSLTAANALVTNAATVNYTASFASQVTGLTASNFTLSGTGTNNASIGTPTSTDNINWNIPVTTGDDGTLLLIFANATNLSPNVTNTSFDGDNSYTIDKTPPTAIISAPSVASIGNNGVGTVTYTITYADANFNASNLTGAGITLNNPTGTATGTVTVTGSGTSYTVTISNISGLGTLGISLTGGYASDQAGNTDAGAGPSATFNVLSSDAALANFTISNGTLINSFSRGTLTYTDVIANLTSSITVVPTSDDPNATIIVDGNAVTTGIRSSSIPMNIGANTLTIVVTAADGVTTQTYTITVNRPLPNNAILSSITLAPPATLVGSTGPGNYNFTAAVAGNVSSIQETPTAQDGLATITVNGSVVASGSLSQSIPLNIGATTITTVVTAEDGSTTKTYIVTVNRALPNVATLSNLTISAGTLSPAFAGGTLSYTESVPYAVASVTLNPTTTDPNATVTVNGNAASTPVTLNVGLNKITTVVTAQNGTTKTTYITYVTRAVASTNALYTSIALSPVSTLVGATGPGYLNFKTNVFSTESSVQVIAVAKDPAATITVNGQAVISGTASQAIALNVGANTITTVITAQDGVTTKSAIITVTRAAPPAVNNVNESISVTKPAEQVTLEDRITVHQAVSPNGDGINDYLTIDGITNYPDNSLAIIDRNGVMVYQAKGYDNSSKLFDGHSNINGKMQLPGTYFYSLDYTVNGENKHKTGYIILKY